MAKAKPVQIAILVLGAVALIYTVVRQIGSRSDTDPVPHFVRLVDVQSGDIFEVYTKTRAVSIPERSPDSGKCSLIGIYRSDAGRWVVSRRDLGALDEDVENKAVDEESGELLNQTPKVRALE